MAADRVRAIIFDIGRVLIRVDIARAMQGLATARLTAQEVWSAIENDPRWRDWQEGRIGPRDWHLHLTKRLGSTLTFGQFTDAWNSALDPQPLQPEEFLEKLSKKYRLALLSNTDPIHMSFEETRFPFFRFFPVRIYSHRVGASKPSPIIYREALKACKVSATEAVYIDDVEAYAQAATRLGLRAIIYQSPEQLRSDLQSLGVVT